MTKKKLKSNTARWENGELGQSREHVGVVHADEEVEIDDALGLKLVSVRVQNSLIKDLKEPTVKEELP